MKQSSLLKYGVESYAMTQESKDRVKNRNQSKRERDVVKNIMKLTTKKQRGKLGLCRGWYQLPTQTLESVLANL